MGLEAKIDLFCGLIVACDRFQKLVLVLVSAVISIGDKVSDL